MASYLPFAVFPAIPSLFFRSRVRLYYLLLLEQSYLLEGLQNVYVLFRVFCVFFGSWVFAFTFHMICMVTDITIKRVSFHTIFTVSIICTFSFFFGEIYIRPTTTSFGLNNIISFSHYSIYAYIENNF